MQAGLAAVHLAAACLAIGACGGGSPAAPTRTTPPPPPSIRGLTGTIVEGLSDSGIGGASLELPGLGTFTTAPDGTFRIEAADPEQVRSVTIRSGQTVERITHLRVPGPETRLALIPSSFDLTAFDAMLRSSGLLNRWVEAPRLTIQARVLQFSNVSASEYLATSSAMTDAEVDQLAEDLSWGLSQLTGGRFADFAVQLRETANVDVAVTVRRTGQIVVARYAGLHAATGFWGYGRWATTSGTVVAGIIMLDRDFELSGSVFRRSLRAHELGHALGYNHVTNRPSVMNSSARLEPNDFDLSAARLAFLRPPGNRSPDTDPDEFTSNIRIGPAVWSGAH